MATVWRAPKQFQRYANISRNFWHRIAYLNLTISNMQPETEAISVFVRVRPFLGEEDTNCEFVKCDLNNHSVTIAAQPETKTFTYDDVASPDASQSDVYNMVARSVAPCVLKGTYR